MLLGLSGVGGVFNEEVDSQFLELFTFVFHAPLDCLCFVHACMCVRLPVSEMWPQCSPHETTWSLFL